MTLVIMELGKLNNYKNKNMAHNHMVNASPPFGSLASAKPQ